MRKINDTYRGTLSSYCYVLMVIHFLQSAVHCNPPVLPCLQSAGRTAEDKPLLGLWVEPEARKKPAEMGPARCETWTWENIGNFLDRL